MKREFAELADSSPNPVTRVNAANTQVNASTNWIERQGPSIRMNPNSKMTDLMRIFNSRVILDKEDYTSTPERIEKNKEFTSKWMSMGAAVLGNELNNSLPLFDSKGQLRLYKIDKNGPGPYTVEDITEGYSMFGDRNVFSEEYATSIPMFIEKTAEITDTPVKDVKDLFNAIIVANSDVGKRIAAGQDTRGRFISLESPMNNSAPVPPNKVQEILDKILPSSSHSTYSSGRPYEFTMDSAKEAEEDSSTLSLVGKVLGAPSWSSITAPVEGTVEVIQKDNREGFDRRLLLRDNKGNYHTFSSNGLAPLVRQGDFVTKGQILGVSDKSVKEKTYSEAQARELFKS